MFEQHPVPQQISSYQFRLVGDMTIKQFFQIAAGAIVALIIYGLPFPSFIKWPLIAIAALSGAAFAFLPIQDRPLEQWLFAFFRSIYSPTYFVWRKQDPPPQYFKAPEAAEQAQVQNQTILTDEQEHALELKNGVATEEDNGVVPDFIMKDDPPQELYGASQAQAQPAAAPQSEPKQEMEVPKQEPVAVERQVVEEEKVQTPQQDVYTSQVGQVLGGNQPNQQQSTQAQFSQDAAPPLPPDQPNIIKGQVMDSSGHIIDGAIIEIKDSAGRPVRALRSNKAGHFQIVTSLPDGEYNITIEKDDYQFSPLSIKATGEIINPIAIRANNT